LIVREYFLDRISDEVGELSKKADRIVEKTVLYARATKLELKKNLRLGKGEDADVEGEPSILSGALEAVIGALYIDQGLEVARDFIMHKVLTEA